MNDDDQGRSELDAAAEVFAATRAIDDAIADLAARPLDEAAADRMRAILSGAGLIHARAAMRRLAVQPRGRRHRLAMVPTSANPTPRSPTESRTPREVSHEALDPSAP